ncbi:MAG TPA: alpha/beta hydrolase [Blastocatellia bacterium]
MKPQQFIFSGNEIEEKSRRFRFSRLNSKKVYAVIAPIVLAYFAFYGLRWAEYAATFHPERYVATQTWATPRGGEDVWFASEGNLKLHGWFINSQTKPALATVIYFHGNSGNISHVGWLGESLSRRGFNVLLFDYRGYGRSEGSISDEQNIYADADAAYNYVIGQLGISPAQVVLYGQSLGTTAAVDLASRRQASAIILESGLSSASRMAEKMMGWLPRFLHGLGQNRFERAKKLAGVHCPVFITHGDPDPTIPTEQGRELFAAANEPKKLMVIPGAGHCVFGFGGDDYFDQLAAFIRDAIGKKLPEA